MRVDLDGLIIPGSFHATAPRASPYVAKLETITAKMRFWPAVIDGCAVNGHYAVDYQL